MDAAFALRKVVPGTSGFDDLSKWQSGLNKNPASCEAGFSGFEDRYNLASKTAHSMNFEM